LSSYPFSLTKVFSLIFRLRFYEQLQYKFALQKALSCTAKSSLPNAQFPGPCKSFSPNYEILWDGLPWPNTQELDVPPVIADQKRSVVGKQTGSLTTGAAKSAS
jgi:hypothetical protein